MDRYFRNIKRRPLIQRVLWGLFVFAVVCFAIALSLSYLSTMLKPEKIWVIAFLGLITPILMGLNLVGLLIMGIRFSRWALFPLVALLLGVVFTGDFLQINFMSTYSAESGKSKKEFTLLSYNVYNFEQYGQPRSRSTMTQIIAFIKKQDPEVICLQEFQLKDSAEQKYIEQQLKEWKYQAYSYLIERGDYRWGLAVFSKFPLIGGTSIKFQSRANSAMYVDAVVGRDTTRLFNCHLQSTQFNHLNKEKLLKRDSAETAKAKYTLRQNYRLRTFQADTIASIIEQSPHRTVVVGDFNEPPISYVYRRIRGEMKDAFRERGVGYGYSYIPLWRIFRIDYLLHSEEIQTLTYDSPLVEWSDHKPIIVKLSLERTK